MKVCIIYVSFHHQNTKKLVQAVASRFAFDCFELKEAQSLDLRAYDMIGFASGIFYGKMNIQLTNFIADKHEDIKQAFVMFTCGMKRKSYTQMIKQFFELCEIPLLGIYGSRGHDTFGPFKYIGGIARNHPNNKDIEKAYTFIQEITSR